ncbi:MAG: gamma-glutamyltransferase [Alphaproteobacteria bacterium]|nr:gamma-glutamyltransferase [Alphaproteobacteria bacterium]
MPLARIAIGIAAILAGSLTAVAVRAAPAVEAEHGMVVSAQHEASAAGLRILEAGGNAVDAAVAVAYALAVVDPCCGNIGGGGYMVIHLAGTSENEADKFIDFRETAPQAAAAGMYLDPAGKPLPDRSLYGWGAVGVPGTVLGLEHARSAYGRLARDAVMAPAIALAHDGFVLGPADAALLNEKSERLSQDPAAARVFLPPGGGSWSAGDRLLQPDFAETLALIARQGSDAFYRGPIAAALAEASAAGGGILTAQDLAGYRVVDAPPVTCRYRGAVIVSSAPSSAGGTILCELLGILEAWDIRGLGFRSPASIHLLVEAMRHAYLDRNTYLGDPAFVGNPLEFLLSPAHAAAIRAAIAPDQATASASLRAGTPPHERSETTHFSVVDRDGNAVALTYTLNGNFGAGVMAPGTGFLLNDEMDDFSVKPGAPNLFGLVQSERNAIAPGKRPLSSIAPTLVERDGRLALVLGSPGGSRIITSVLETVMNVLDYDMSPQAAVEAPRVHQQWLPDTVFYERAGLSSDTIAELTRMGYTLAERAPWGAVELIAIGPDGHLTGASDPRRPAGAAVGY